MPASRRLIAFALLFVSVMVLGAFLGARSQAQAAHSPAHSSALGSALQWLSANQSSTGSYGSYFEHWTAAAAYALWLNNSQSQKAALSYLLLAEQLNSSASWFWGEYGEADVPGAMLGSIAASHNLARVNLTGVSYRLSQFQAPNGGFRGYYDSTAGEGVTSSVDTAMALWGLAQAGAMNFSAQQLAVGYLFSLQNPDGSFNLTETVASDPIYSHAPESVSLTALSVLALGAAFVETSDTRLERGLDFLGNSVSENFTGTDVGGHVYAASLTALALDAYGKKAEASRLIPFIISNQNTDGGFADSSRLSAQSNALDTGWASIALQLVQPEPLRSPALNPLVLTVFVASVAVPVVAILGAVVFFHRRKRRVLTPA